MTVTFMPVLFSLSAYAQVLMTIPDSTKIKICDANLQPELPINFTAKGCSQIPLGKLNPQGKTLWVSIPLTLSQTDLNSLSAPIGLYLYGKASDYVIYNAGILLKPSASVSTGHALTFHLFLKP